VQTSTSGTRLIAGGTLITSPSTYNTAIPLNMAGSLTIDAGTFFDMQDQTATAQPINEDMTVPLTVAFDINNAGTLLASKSSGGNIILGRHWSRTGAGIFTHNNRSVTFNTSRDATLVAPGTGETFYDLIINKPGVGTMGTNYVGYRVTLNSPVAVANNLNLVSGYFITTTNLMTINANASATGGAVETFVSGPLRKLGSVDFRFPVGAITNTGAIEEFHFRPIAISSLGASADYTAKFYRANPYLQGPISIPAKNKGLQLISYCEYWDLTRASGTNTITVTPSWSTHNVWSSKCNTIDYVVDASALVVVPYNGNNPMAGSSVNQWGDIDFGKILNIPSSISSDIPSYINLISWDAAMNYNKFVLGSLNWRLAPLPAEILDFKVQPKGKQTQIQWMVNQEDFVKSYVVERSKDGFSFQPLMNVSSSSRANASYLRFDVAPHNGWNYYRLKLIEQDGSFRYSTTQKLWFGDAMKVQLSPNPVANMLNLYIPEPEKVISMGLFNAAGQRMQERRNVVSNETIDVSAYPVGHYIIRLMSQSGVTTIPFIKQ
jgi:hypothetical protein